MIAQVIHNDDKSFYQQPHSSSSNILSHHPAMIHFPSMSSASSYRQWVPPSYDDHYQLFKQQLQLQRQQHQQHQQQALKPAISPNQTCVTPQWTTVQINDQFPSCLPMHSSFLLSPLPVHTFDPHQQVPFHHPPMTFFPMVTPISIPPPPQQQQQQKQQSSTSEVFAATTLTEMIHGGGFTSSLHFPTIAPPFFQPGQKQNRSIPTPTPVSLQSPSCPTLSGGGNQVLLTTAKTCAISSHNNSPTLLSQQARSHIFGNTNSFIRQKTNSPLTPSISSLAGHNTDVCNGLPITPQISKSLSPRGKMSNNISLATDEKKGSESTANPCTLSPQASLSSTQQQQRRRERSNSQCSTTTEDDLPAQNEKRIKSDHREESDDSDNCSAIAAAVMTATDKEDHRITPDVGLERDEKHDGNDDGDVQYHNARLLNQKDRTTAKQRQDEVEEQDEDDFVASGGNRSCRFCGRIFHQRCNLRAHLRTHTGERPFPCPIESCGKRFAQRSNMKRHLLSHSGIKPFMCPHCGKQTTRKSTLQAHILRKHSQLAVA